MTDPDGSSRALRPLWMLATGASLGALTAFLPRAPEARWIAALLMLCGALAAIAALTRPARRATLMWAMAGLALAGGRGVETAAERATLEAAAADPAATLRVRMVVLESWTASRWGRRTRVRVLTATARDRAVHLPRRSSVEVRGEAVDPPLPGPGAVVRSVVRVSGEPHRPLLVIPSARLISGTGETRALPALRDRLARDVLAAAGTHVGRIRAAEMAAALALGRKDLLPRERQQWWRRSGFAHLLAVSGLHVGVVAGAVFFTLAVGGAGPRLTRAATMLAVPAYALLAGAAPSALRAALMVVIFLGSRFFGRAVLPMAAVLLAAITLVMLQPEVIGDAGFQLTVVITAALVRWVPPVARWLPGPLWLSGSIAVPVVAQLAAAPLIAVHFRRIIPAALIGNVLALPLLAPAILLALAAVGCAALSPAAGAVCLQLLHVASVILSSAGAAARTVEITTPHLPYPLLLVLVGAGWWALQAYRSARVGAAVWTIAVLAVVLSGLVGLDVRPSRVEVLPVHDGTAVLFVHDGSAVLFDSGRHPDRAVELVADAGVRRLAALVASHSDEDHIGGMVRIIDTAPVHQLLMPYWMVSAAESVPLLRAARRRSVHLRPVAAGSVVRAGRIAVEVMWPPAEDVPRIENERSLVARIGLGSRFALATADIGRRTEGRLPAGGRLRSDVLLVPHHGSRSSSSPALLAAVAPEVALIPAAPDNTYGHPHSEVLQRLRARHIIFRTPGRDSSCGAVWDGTRWQVFP